MFVAIKIRKSNPILRYLISYYEERDGLLWRENGNQGGP
jgi:hypothetical protein